jgi:hypothetical protein
MKRHPLLSATSLLAALFVLPSPASSAEQAPLKKEKLQIVICLGQSNMVGVADVKTAWYLTQPQYVPPREACLTKSRFFDWNFYWSGVRYYQGPRKAELDELVEARQKSRMKWRQRVNGANGIQWDEAAWGPKPKPGGGRATMYAFLDEKAEQEGIYKRIAEILDSPENKFTVNDAFTELSNREKEITAEVKRVREIYLNGTKPEDFDAFDAEVAAAVKDKSLVLSVPKGSAFTDAEKQRAAYAELARKHLKLPIAERTRIFGHGAIAGSEGEGIKSTTHGPLSVGYGGGPNMIGPEYGLGITLERLVDAPILLVKCSWGNTALSSAWRPWSLDGVETPIEKATREAFNKEQAEIAKKEGREFTPRPAPAATGGPGWCWGLAMPQIEKVLADPGKYYPGYDPKVGYEVAGLVWFQGYSDLGNPAYGELLAQMIRDFREKVKTPKMPFVCGTLGMEGFKNSAFSNDVNAGMLAVSKMPEFADTVGVINTSPFYPQEFDLLTQVLRAYPPDSPEHKEALRMRQHAVSEKGFHYHGSAKFFLLNGDALARSLAGLMAK